MHHERNSSDFFIYIAICTLFIVIAFFINRKRLIKKYNLEHGINPIPQKEEVKPTINTTRQLLIANLVVVAVIIIYIFFPHDLFSSHKPVTASLKVNELIEMSKMDQDSLAIHCMRKGFFELYKKTDRGVTRHRLYQKVTADKNEPNIEFIYYHPDTMGNLTYYIANASIYTAFSDSLKQLDKEIIPDPVRNSYSIDSIIYSQGCVIRNIDYSEVLKASGISVVSIRDYENSIKQLVALEQKKQKQENAYKAMVKFDYTYLYETASYDYKRVMYFDKGAIVTYSSVSNDFTYISTTNGTGWIPSYQLELLDN